MSKQIALLGSTGSIGTQSLDVIEAQGYTVTALAAHSNIELLYKQIIRFKPKYVGVVNSEKASQLENILNGQPFMPKLIKGEKAIEQLAKTDCDVVLNAVVGIAGLCATLAAIENKTDVALANKESLVTGGKLVIEGAEKNNVKILPVDSEHSAIFQCLQDKNSARALKKIILTASGGPFFGFNREQLKTVTKKDALKHPNWSMGNKITIDSATLMNKGLELIEAAWLFDMPCDKIDIVVQRQSIIHSMVQFDDNSVLAQLGVPDMRIPIQYALTWPKRVEGPAPELDFYSLKSITFDKADEETFRCLSACKKAIKKGGLAPCAANGANEKAVELFLNDKISFLKIGELVEKTVDEIDGDADYTIEDVYKCDKWARNFVMRNI